MPAKTPRHFGGVWAGGAFCADAIADAAGIRKAIARHIDACVQRFGAGLPLPHWRRQEKDCMAYQGSCAACAASADQAAPEYSAIAPCRFAGCIGKTGIADA